MHEENTHPRSTYDRFLYPKTDAAKALSISIRTLEYLIKAGEIAVRRIGRRTLIPRSELIRFSKINFGGTTDQVQSQ